MQDLHHFARASDYFLGKKTDEIADVILHVLEAHLRDIYEHIALKYIEEGNHICVHLSNLQSDISQDNSLCFPRNDLKNPCSTS